MNINKSVLVINNYGKITIKLKDIIEDLGITRNYLARAINTRFEVIDKWYKDDIENLDLDILARICHVLNCKPSDIIDYIDSPNMD